MPSPASQLRRLGASALSFGGPGPAPDPNLRFGGYEIIEELGRGGMGVVYLARQAGLERMVALKVVSAGRLAAVEADSRFQREARLAARLRHPHIVAVHDSGHADGQAFYSMDFLDGGDLAQRLRAKPPTPREAAEMARKLAEAVAYAHREGVVHRDLKPSNVLLDSAGEPRIGDFGLAAPLEAGGDLTAVTSVLGTPHYLAPEGFARGSAALGVASDVYALGAILYEMLTGRAPFAGTNSAELPAVVASREPPAPKLFNASVETDLQTVCLKCLEKAPERRYASAQDLADDLGRWLRLEPIVARPLSGPARLWRWARRRPALAAAWLLLAALSVVSALSAVFIARERSAATEQLRASLLAQARSIQLSGQNGQRFEALDALRRAAAIRKGEDLRDEAIKVLALPDVRTEKRWKARFDLSAPIRFDATATHLITEASAGVLVRRRVADGADVERYAPLAGNPRAIFVGGFSADGTRFVARFAGDLVAVFALGRPEPLLVLRDRPALQPHIYFAHDLILTPDGREVGCAHRDGGISFHDLATGRETTRLLPPGMEGKPATVAALSPDGMHVALIPHRSRRIYIVERATGRLLQRLQHGVQLIHAAWHPHGRMLASSAVDNQIQFWDAVKGERTAVLEGHRGIPIALAFSPDGRRLASSGREFSLRLWDVPAQRALLEMPEIGGGAGIGFSADGRRLTFSDAEWDAGILGLALDDVCRLLLPLPAGDYFEETACLDLTPDGRLAVIASRVGVRLVDPQSGSVLALLHAPPPAGDGDPEPAAQNHTALFSPAGDAVFYSASGSGIWRRSLRWRDPSKLLLGRTELIAARRNQGVIAISRDASVLLLSAERSSRAAVLYPGTDRPVVELDLPGVVCTAAFSPDGTQFLLAEHSGQGARSSDVRLWDAQRGVALRSLGIGPDAFVQSIPGTDLADIGTSEKAAFYRWPELTPLPGTIPSGAPTGSPDGRLLALIADRVRLLRVSDRRILCTLPINSKTSVRFHPDGRHLLVYAGQRLDFWDLRAVRRELAGIGLDWEGAEFETTLTGTAGAALELVGE